MSKVEVRSVEASGSAKALTKGLALVDVVAESEEPVRLPDLVAASGLPRTTVLRLLEALCDHMVLTLDSAGRYRLGSQVAVWGQRYLDRLDVREAALEVMQQLADETTETCFLGVREEHEVRYVGKVGGMQAVSLAARIGSRMPLHSTGIGKALLAYSTEDVIDSVLAGPLAVRTERTITDAEDLLKELRRIRRRGYSTDDGENEDGVRCVAVPIRDASGSVMAAISISAPAYRFDLRRLAELAPRMQDAAELISVRLGLPGPRERNA